MVVHVHGAKGEAYQPSAPRNVNSVSALRTQVRTNDDAESEGHILSQLELYLKTSWVGDYLEMFSVTLALVSFAVYIVETYNSESVTHINETVLLPDAFYSTFEYIACSLFLAEFLLKFLVEKKKFVFLTSSDGITIMCVSFGFSRRLLRHLSISVAGSDRKPEMPCTANHCAH